MTRSDVGKGHPEYYQDYAARLAKEMPGAFFADQFNNPANPLAHETSTGPEIWQQCGHELDAIVVGVGSGGTLTGLARFFKRVQPQAGVRAGRPGGLDPVRPGDDRQARRGGLVGGGRHRRGLRAGHRRLVGGVAWRTRSPTSESFATARELLKAEGLLGGSSTGTLLAAALRYCREQKEPKRVVTFVCDTGTRYLSKVYNDAWMIDEGLLAQRRYGDLRDLIARRAEDGSVVSVGPQRHAAHRVPAHAAGRRAAAAGARRQRQTGRRGRRIGPAAARAGRRRALRRAGVQGDEHARCKRCRPAADIAALRQRARQWPGGDRRRCRAASMA